MPTLESFFENVQLPSISEIAQTLISTLNQDETSIEELSTLISHDPALSAKLLRLANSAQFGLPRAVGTIDDAIALVGLEKVRTLALAACLTGTFPQIPGLDRKTFWTSSMACAHYAQWLAEFVGSNGQVAWLTGMMLRLGELLIVQANPQILQEIEKMPRIPGVRWQREKRLTGFTEGQITAELARRWNFPLQMVQALQRSADPMEEQGFSRLGAIIHLAGLLAEQPHAEPESVKELPVDVINILNLDLDWMRNTFPCADHIVDVS
jgi:HD-like signal output (HDOD) protein